MNRLDQLRGVVVEGVAARPLQAEPLRGLMGDWMQPIGVDVEACQRADGIAFGQGRAAVFGRRVGDDDSITR